MLLSQQTAQRTRPTDANHIGRFAGKSQTEIWARVTEELESVIQTTPARGTPRQVLPPDHNGIVVSFVGACGRFHLVHQQLHRRAVDLNQEAVKNGSRTPRRLPAPPKREQPKEGLHKVPCPSCCLQSHSYVVALWYRTCASAFYGHCATPG